MCGKVCEACGVEIATRDGINRCASCEGKKTVSAKKRKQRNAMEDAMRSCGLVKVRGAMGGTYWE